MNIDTDTQWAYWDGIENLKLQITIICKDKLVIRKGKTNQIKNIYDPRVWVRKGEESMIARLQKAFEDLNAINSI